MKETRYAIRNGDNYVSIEHFSCGSGRAETISDTGDILNAILFCDIKRAEAMMSKFRRGHKCEIVCVDMNITVTKMGWD